MTEILIKWFDNFLANYAYQSWKKMTVSESDVELLQQLLNAPFRAGTVKFDRRGEVQFANLRDLMIFLAELHDCLYQPKNLPKSRLAVGKQPIMLLITQEWSDAA